MARTATGVILALLIVTISAVASYLAWQRTIEPGTIVNKPAAEPPAAPVVKPAPTPTPPAVQPAAVQETQAPSSPSGTTGQPGSPNATAAKVTGPLPLVYAPDGIFGPDNAFGQNLAGIAIDRQQDLLYAVGDRNLIIWWDLKTGRQAGRHSTSRENLCISTGAGGAIYVGQPGRAEKYVRQADGRLIRQFKIGEGQLKRVTAVHAVGQTIVCADAESRNLVFFNEQGQPLNRQIPDKQIALIGGPPARIMLPNETLDFAVDRRGQIVLAHPGRHAVQTYSAEGKLLANWGRFSEQDPDGFTGCCNPINVASFSLRRLGRTEVTGDGQGIVTAEKGPPRVKVYDEAGKLLALIDASHFNAGNRQMYLAVDGQARIYVADTEARVIRRFASRN